MRLLILGATAGLGRSLTEEAACRGHDVLLVASDPRDLAAVASHVRLAYSVNSAYVCVRLGTAVRNENEILVAAKEFGPLDGVLYPVGWAHDNDNGQLDAQSASSVLDINFAVQMRITTDLWPLLAKQPMAFVVGFGSVASIRGRRRNVVYAAAKRALLSYFESLQHLASGTSIRVHFYQLGYLDTQQTMGKRLLFPKAPPQKIAKLVFDRLESKQGVMFYPRFWYLVSVLMRMLPWPIYRRLNF